MKRFHYFLYSLLFICTMGAGPCDIIDRGGDGDDDDDAAGETCATTNIQCQHSLDIDVLLAGTTEYPAGTYTFEIIAPDQSRYVIDCYLPRADFSMEECTGNVQELQAQIDADDYTRIHFYINGAPPSCTIRVSYNDALLIEKVIEPDYDITYPNGANCEPACYSGEEAVAVAIY
jgi:hypothetical protein